jgi:hypothetical protein
MSYLPLFCGRRPSRDSRELGKSATFIQIADTEWEGFGSSGNPGFVFDNANSSVTDCSVEDLTIDGNERSFPQSGVNKPPLGVAGGINCTVREFVSRVSLYDILGWSIYFQGSGSEEAQVIDCDARSPFDGQHFKGNDTIGGLGYRNKVIRFHWAQGLDKQDALDLTNGGGGGECSVDILDCINDSGLDILLEGCYQSSVVGCRFYSSTLKVYSDAKYGHATITNPKHILVANCLFVGAGTGTGGPQAAIEVYFDGGDYQGGGETPTNLGGQVCIVNNRFVTPLTSAIQWAGDDASTSQGGSLIAGNRITDPNASGQEGTTNIEGAFMVSLGQAYAAGIAVMSSYGLAITDNSVFDSLGNMPYAMQLMREDAAPPAQAQRILVKGNLLGNATGVGFVAFYLSSYGSATNPLPMLFQNTNQLSGFDASQVLTMGMAWPPISAGGYPYNALVAVATTSMVAGTTVAIDGHTTNLTSGPFYVPLGQQITVSWTGSAPTITVFRLT